MNSETVSESSREGTTQTIIQMEKAALHRWLNGDPGGFLEISAQDVVYFDPFIEQRLDGLAGLTGYFEALRGKVHANRYDLLNPKVQVIGEAAVLTFNFVSYGGNEDAMRWNCTEVYRCEQGQWRIIQTHWSLTKR
jgi:ketosteroid isomerase-like protein